MYAWLRIPVREPWSGGGRGVECFVDILEVKVVVGLVGRSLRLLVGGCVSDRTRGGSGRGAELIVFVLEGGIFGEVSCMRVVPFLCVFVLDGALFGDDVEGFVSDLVMYIM